MGRSHSAPPLLPTRLHNLSRSGLPRTCVSPHAEAVRFSSRVSGKGFGLVSRDIASCCCRCCCWGCPKLRAAEWWRLRSRYVRLLCCGLGDGACLREETEEEGKEEEGKEEEEEKVEEGGR